MCFSVIPKDEPRTGIVRAYLLPEFDRRTVRVRAEPNVVFSASHVSPNREICRNSHTGHAMFEDFGDQAQCEVGMREVWGRHPGERRSWSTRKEVDLNGGTSSEEILGVLPVLGKGGRTLPGNVDMYSLRLNGISFAIPGVSS